MCVISLLVIMCTMSIGWAGHDKEDYKEDNKANVCENVSNAGKEDNEIALLTLEALIPQGSPGPPGIVPLKN